VNKFRLEKEDPLEILDIDNTAVRISQIERLKKLRAERDESACQAALTALADAAASGNGNLLELAVEAAKMRASLGEKFQMRVKRHLVATKQLFAQFLVCTAANLEMQMRWTQ
jgi:methylmalonyl-CoA mutase N-terminal domain/subunit